MTIVYETLFKFLTDMVPKHTFTAEMICRNTKTVSNINRFWVLSPRKNTSGKNVSQNLVHVGGAPLFYLPNVANN